MPNVISVKDQLDLIPTNKFPLIKFPFERFNPIQSRFFDYYDHSSNMVIAASTSSGKTTIAEMALAYERFNRGGKGMYIAPLKALSQEKVNDWSDKSHDFSSFNLSICTGDYRLTSARKKELDESEIILLTSEMWNSRVRNFRSEKNDWIKEVGTCVIDESHLVGTPSRGDKLEVAIMKMATINPNCRFIFLSATMPNVGDMAGWLTKITDRDTVILQSEYRPVPLKWNWPVYDDSYWEYQYKEEQKVEEAVKIINKYSKDKFLVFAHSKSSGRLMCKALKSEGIETYFHNADLERSKRVKVEDRFKNDPELRVLVATSTLSQGINLPARRVIILGTTRGLSPVPTYEIEQEAGRAGRPKYDKLGDVYVLLPRSKCGKERLRLENPDEIRSQLLQHDGKDYKTFAFHLVSEITQRDIKNIDDIYEWYSKSLASFQFRNLEEDFVEKVLDKLIQCGTVKDENGELFATPLGRVAALFYYSPFDVSDLKKNFTNLFDYEREKDVLWVATALAHVDSNNDPPFVSNLEKSQLEQFRYKIGHDLSSAFNKNRPFTEQKIKMIFCYNSLLNGWDNPVFSSVIRGLRYDADRLVQVLKALDGMSAKWEKQEYLNVLGKRLQYGMEWNLLDLVSISQIGKVRAEKLWKANIRTASDLIKKPKLTKSVLKCSDKMLEKIITAAKKMV
jgi:helicase